MRATFAEFSAIMTALGPWPLSRRVAVAVSGGADSLCLALLTKSWGDPLALVVDHGLRSESADEAHEAVGRLAGFGVPARVLTLFGLAPGPGLAERARDARYAALAKAAAEAGCVDLLLGHHANDQAETFLMRRQSGSGAAGLAGMPAIAIRPGLRLVRPLLGVPPGRLRATLTEAGILWVEDPSNRNPEAGRTQARNRLNDADGTAPSTAALLRQMRAYGQARVATEARIAATLAERAAIFPQGYATLAPGPIDAESLAALIRMLAGTSYPPARDAVARLLAGGLRGTLGGVRLMPAGRLGPGTLLVREAAAMQPEIPARPGGMWDRRFRLDWPFGLPNGATIGPLGADAAQFRRPKTLGSAILATLPAVRDRQGLVAVPHLGYFKEWTNPKLRLRLCPSSAAAGAGFVVCGAGDAQTHGEHHVPYEAVANPASPGGVF
jgi:tRNA(Ile)-lysidine synthase